jgi:hypothetical protein
VTENVDMRTDPGVNSVLNGHREHHHHNLLAQHLDGPSCGHDPRKPILPGRGRSPRFDCVFEYRDEDEYRDSSTYVTIPRDFDSAPFAYFLCLRSLLEFRK